MTKKTGLGKGLGALIPEGFEIEIENSNRELVYIDTKKIKPNELQPRKSFDKTELEALSKSIERNGVIQPILLRKVGKNYEIIAGERRWRASMMVGLKQMPAIILNADDMQRYEMSLVENIQRVQLNPIEEAIAYRELISKYEVTHEQMSDIVGKSRAYVTNSIRLLNLCPEVKEMLEKSEISTGHGKLLLGLDEKNQFNLAKKIARDKMSVREVEKHIKALNNTKKTEKTLENPELIEVSEQLMQRLGTKVAIKAKRTKRTFKGKIEIEFYSENDFNQILDELGLDWCCVWGGYEKISSNIQSSGG